MTGQEDDRAEVDRRFAEIVRNLREEAAAEGETAGQDRPEDGSGPEGDRDGPEAPDGLNDPPVETGPVDRAETSASQDAPETGPGSGPGDQGAGEAPPGPRPAGASAGPSPGWRGWEDPEEEEHFVPPPPPPLPAGDLHLWGIVAGLLGGPLVLVLAHVFQVLDGAFWTWLGLGLGMGGAWLLWLRLPTQRDEGPHGGAQV